MKKSLLFLFFFSQFSFSAMAAVLPADKAALQQLTATNVNQMLAERDGHLLPIAPISASRNYLTNTCNIGSPAYEWRYVYAKKFYRDGVELVGGGAGIGDVMGPNDHAANYVPQWNPTADSKTLVEGFPITGVGKTFVNQSTTANMLSYIGGGNTTAPATNTASNVPQWAGTNSKTLVDGFPITTAGKTLVNQSSTANIRSNLGLSNHEFIGVDSEGGISTVGTINATVGDSTMHFDSEYAEIDCGAFTELYLSCSVADNAGGQGLNFFDTHNNKSKWTFGRFSDNYAANTKYQNAFYVKQWTNKSDTSVDDVRLLISDNGNVGIGTDTPQGKLSVSGNVYVTGNIYVSSVKVPTTRTITFGIDGGGSVPATGNLAATYLVPVSQTITNWYISSDATGNAVVDVIRNGTSIIGSGNKPTLTSASSATAAVSSWTSAILTAGDRLVFKLDSITTAKSVTVTLKTKEQ